MTLLVREHVAFYCMWYSPMLTLILPLMASESTHLSQTIACSRMCLCRPQKRDVFWVSRLCLQNTPDLKDLFTVFSHFSPLSNTIKLSSVRATLTFIMDVTWNTKCIFLILIDGPLGSSCIPTQQTTLELTPFSRVVPASTRLPFTCCYSVPPHWFVKTCCLGYLLHPLIHNTSTLLHLPAPQGTIIARWYHSSDQSPPLQGPKSKAAMKGRRSEQLGFR